MPTRETVEPTAFNPAIALPFELRLKDFEIAMQDVYDFFFDVNSLFQAKGLEEVLRAANTPAQNRSATRFTEVFLSHVSESDFRKNDRGPLGTRTATIDRAGVQKMRSNWIYLTK